MYFKKKFNTTSSEKKRNFTQVRPKIKIHEISQIRSRNTMKKIASNRVGFVTK